MKRRGHVGKNVVVAVVAVVAAVAVLVVAAAAVRLAVVVAAVFVVHVARKAVGDLKYIQNDHMRYIYWVNFDDSPF